MKTIKGSRSVNRDALEAFRLRAIELREKMGYSVTEIAAIFGVHYNSASRWFCKYRAGGMDALRKTTAPGAQPILDEGVLHWLEDALLLPATAWGFSTPLWTVPMVGGLLRDGCKVKVHRTTVWRYLRRLGLTWQKPEKRYAEQNRELVETWIAKEWPKIKRYVREKNAILYFEDESGISLTPVVGKTWAKKANPPEIRFTGKRGGITAMSAVSPSGRMRFRLVKKRINAGIMIEFLGQLLKSHKRRRIAVVMDQAPCHKAKKVLEYANNSKRLRLFFIPPYSPELNPDEKVWRRLKGVELKDHQARNKSQLTKLTLSALKSMQKKPELLASFFDNYLT